MMIKKIIKLSHIRRKHENNPVTMLLFILPRKTNAVCVQYASAMAHFFPSGSFRQMGFKEHIKIQ